MKHIRWAIAAAAVAGGLGLSGNNSVLADSAEPLYHLHLLKSQPAVHDTVTVAPTAVSLWFSEEPQLALASVKITAADSSVVTVGKLTHAKGSSSPVVAPVTGTMKPGTYSVAWRAASMDGHPVKGAYKFVLKAK